MSRQRSSVSLGRAASGRAGLKVMAAWALTGLGGCPASAPSSEPLAANGDHTSTPTSATGGTPANPRSTNTGDAGPTNEGSLAAASVTTPTTTSTAGTVLLCHPVEQDCPDGLKCVVSPPGPPTCQPATEDDRSRGQPCFDDECAGGLACVRRTSTVAHGRCETLCDFYNGTGCTHLGRHVDCQSRIEGTDWGACRPLPDPCEPQSQRPCEADEACQPFLHRTDGWAFRCQPAGPRVLGEPCDDAQCQRGLVCVADMEGLPKCWALCESNAECLPPYQCVGIVESAAFRFCAF